MPGVPWTARDRDRLRQLFAAGCTYDRAAELLGRTVAAVAGQARRSAAQKGRALTVAARRRRVARLNKTGLCPEHIARRVGVRREQVVRDLARLGLTPHTLTRTEQGRLVAARVKWKYQMSLGAMRVERQRVASFAAGWPPVSAAHAGHLAAFHRLGRLTVRGLMAARGLGLQGAEVAVAKLAAAGHLVRVGTARKGAFVYDLAPAVRERRDRVAAYQSADIPA